MAKKKKEGKKKEEEIEDEPSPFSNMIQADAKKSLIFVFLLTFGVLSVLGFFEAAGLLGSWIDTGIGALFGYGKWLLPILLFGLAGMMLLGKSSPASEAVKYAGLITMYLSILGLIHLMMGDDMESLKQIAQAGEGGGYVGFALAALFLMLAGKVAAVILLLAILVAGVIMAFNVSLAGSLQGIWKKKEELTEQKESASDEEESVLPQEEMKSEGGEEAPQEEAPKTILEEHNISLLEFPDEEEELLAELDGEDVEDEDQDDEQPVVQKRKRRSRYAWKLPAYDLVEYSRDKAEGGDTAHNISIIQKTLKYLGIEVEPGEVTEGPTVTQYTFTPAPGVKISRITTLNNDLALALAKHPIRIEAPIPGKSLIGIEVLNQKTAQVRLRNILESREFKEKKGNLTVVLGEDVSGKNVLANLQKMPHLLIAGRTGSGKSVCINTLLLSLLFQNSPEDLKLILVDPKRVELSMYKDIPHLKTSVITDMKKVVSVLKWAVGEMERRYQLLEEAGTRDLMGYHEKYTRGEKKIATDKETNESREVPLENLPFIVIVIDEVADLMAQHGKEVEAIVSRLTAKSRAIGIHLVLATQRPEATVITGLIKANIPSRIAFQLKSHIDSRTILDAGGAEKLLGNGDMLYAPSEGSETKRIQGVYVTEEEVRRVTQDLRDKKKELEEDEEEDIFGESLDRDELAAALDAVDSGAEQDEMYTKAKEIIINSGKASTTSLQTMLGIGYPKAARLMNLLEENGIVGVVDGKKKVLVGKAGALEVTDQNETKYEDAHITEQADRDKWQM